MLMKKNKVAVFDGAGKLAGKGKVKVELTTHSVGGLSDNDFILAAKIDRQG